MKLSFISDDFSIEDLQFARAEGFSGLEINVHIQVGDPNEDRKLRTLEARRDEIRRLLDEYGLSISGLGIWELNFLDEATQKKCLEYYERMVALAQALKCPVLYHGAGQLQNASELEQVERYIPVGKRLVELAQNGGVRPCLYSCHMVNFAWDPTTWEAIFSSLPGLGLKYDPSHLFHEGKPYLEALALFLSRFRRVYHVHAKDVRLLPEDDFLEPPIGMGEIDWPGILGLLYTYGYEGSLSLEPHRRWAGKQLRYLGLRLGKQYLETFLT